MTLCSEVARLAARPWRILGLIAIVTTRALAQAAPTPDQMLMRAADSITVGDVCQTIEPAMKPAVIVVLTASHPEAPVDYGLVCDPDVSALSLAGAFGRSMPGGRALARMTSHDSVSFGDRKRLAVALAHLATALEEPDVRQALSESSATAVQQVVVVRTTITDLTRLDVIDSAVARLDHYERKLGPTSPKLNGLEVALNYLAQRSLPFFRPTPLGGPRHLEIVASYSPAYMTFLNGTMTPVSVTEYGVRYYMFGKRYGRNDWFGQFAFPSYWSVGGLTSNDENGALVAPWTGRIRFGGFFSWGAIKVGYVARDRGRFMVSKQFQAVRFLF